MLIIFSVFGSENPVLSTAVITRINKLPSFKKLKNFELKNISEGFDIDTFGIFVKVSFHDFKKLPIKTCMLQNHSNHAKFNLQFSDIITSKEYVAKLQKLADTIINEGINGPRVMLMFPQLEGVKARTIELIYHCPLATN